jgi:hypothetical protein
MRPQLSWRAAMRIAWREMRASRAKFLFVVLSVAIGVGSLTGVRGCSSFRHAAGEARTLMAGDLTARVFALPTAEQSRRCAVWKRAGRGARITETLTMARLRPRQNPPFQLAVGSLARTLLRRGDESAASLHEGIGRTVGRIRTMLCGSTCAPATPAHRRSDFRTPASWCRNRPHDGQPECSRGNDHSRGFGPHGLITPAARRPDTRSRPGGGRSSEQARGTRRFRRRRSRTSGDAPHHPRGLIAPPRS